jgi:outer membrane protein OmpA-like peptidoglycan-associated protein
MASFLFCGIVLLYQGLPMDKVHPQDYDGRFGVGWFGSAVKMVLGKVDHSTVDQWAGLTLGIGLSPATVFSFSGGYGWVYPRDPLGSQFTATSHYRTILVPAIFSIDLLAGAESRTRPYVSFGGGLLHWSVRDIRGTVSVWDRGRVVRQATDVSVHFGLGLETLLGDWLALRLFGRFHYIFKGNEDTIGTGDDNRAVAEAGVGLTIWRGRKKDSDGDGIPDRWDLCPYQPEDYDGFEDLDGCPEPDNDGDGIPDLKDECRDLSEDRDGFQDDDGCPDPDNDGDGIPDIRDDCPNQAEDLDGFQDLDGCPDEDNDGDGIPDEKDKCPNRPETPNGYQDDDGCPDEAPVFLQVGQVWVLREIRFRSGSAHLQSSSFAVLDSLAVLLHRHPDVVVEIAGHTDNVGSWDFNLRLSQKRAEAVREYLIFKGIDPNRLRAVGYGESRPIASNATRTGREQNRRIEIIRIR